MNIFSTAQALKGAFKTDLARARINGESAGLLLQNVQFSFSQAVTMLYELGSSDVYYVVGRAQGSAGISRVVGPASLNIAFLQRFGDGCRAPSNTIQLAAQGGCAGSQGGVTYSLEGCLITSISGGINAQDMLINEQLQMTYVNLDMA